MNFVGGGEMKSEFEAAQNKGLRLDFNEQLE